MSATVSPPRRLRRAALWLSLAAATATAPALSQGMPPSPVRYTEAREHLVHGSVQLPGTVESRSVSVVASEVEGAVIKLHVREGDTVRKGQPLAELRATNLQLRLEAATAQLKEAESRYKQAELSLKRARELFASQVASQQDLDNAVSEHTAWQGRVESLQAEISRLKLALELSTIRAPFAGLISSERTEVGQWLDVGGPVVELISLADLEVRLDVPERYFSRLNPGASATVAFASLPGLQVKGRVSAIVPRADAQARTFPIKIKIPNREGRIGVGMLAQVSFPAGDSYRATVVPKDAVVNQGAEQFVYLINGDDTVSMVPIVAGEGVGSWVAVKGEVRAGQKVVTRGNERLRPGVSVRAEPLEYKLP